MEPLPEQESASKEEKRMWTDRLGEILLPVLRAIVASYLTWDMRALRIGDVVEARDVNDEWFLGKIIGIRQLSMRVHFLGWHSAYDQWMSQFCSRDRRSPPSNSCLRSDGCRCSPAVRIREASQLCFFSQRGNLPLGSPPDEIIVGGRPATLQSLTYAADHFVCRVAFRDGRVASCRSAILPCSVPCTDSHFI